MALRIYLLGQFKLQAGDRPIELPSRPAQSLFAYLVLNAGISQRREKLAGLLWPEASDSNARSYLRQALWRLHKALSVGGLDWGEYLQVSDIAVTFDDQAHYWLDVAQLLEPMAADCSAELAAVVALYRGELLPGFYDEWVVADRERLHAAYQQQMSRLLRGLLAAGRWAEVVDCSEQWIRLDHAPEPAYRALLQAHAALGSQGLVAATYQRCQEALQRELGVAPSPETAQLYEQLRRRELGEPPSPPTFPEGKLPGFLREEAVPVADQPVFVAREEELDRLETFLSCTLQGQGQVLFITGEAGAGKTALLAEFSRRAQAAHPQLVVAGGNCNAHTGIGDPYLPFREIMELLTGDVQSRWQAGAISRDHARRLWQTLPLTAQALLDNGLGLIDTFLPGAALAERAALALSREEEWLARLRSLLEREAGNTIVQGPRQDDLFEQITNVLQALARQVPLVLVIDDLQWADLGSISLLFHLGRHLRGSPILIACAYRPEEVALGRDGAQHPLATVVNELGRDFGDIVINIDQAASRGFVEAILDSELNQLGEPFREMLYRQTRGNPLFTIELLRGMQARGDLVQNEAGQWVEGPELNWEMLPARVEAVLAQRIGRLDQQHQELLRCASVEGETFTAEIVAAIQACPERQVIEQLSRSLDKKHRLVAAHTVRHTKGRLLSRYRFRHIQIQKYLYSSLDEVERVHLHQQVGTILEDLYQDQDIAPIALQLARHFQEAHHTQKAIHYLHLAGKKAVQLSAYQEGVKHLTKALSLLMTQPESANRDEQELELQLSLGMALMTYIPSSEWNQAYTRARELCRQTGKTSQLCRILGELSIFHYVRCEHPLALELAEEAYNLAQQEEDRRIVALGAWYLGLVLFATGNYTAARAHFAQIASFYDPHQHHQFYLDLRGSDPGLSALAYDSLCLWCLGYPDQALRRSQKVLGIARELAHPFTSADVLCYAGCIFNIMLRDAVAVQQNARQLRDIAQDTGLVGWLGTAGAYWGESAIMQGHYHEGISRIEQAESIERLSKHVWLYSTGILGALGWAYAQTGQLQLGLKTVDRALRRVEESDERHWEVELRRQRAEILLMDGDQAKAEASLQQAIALARRQRAKSWELRAVISLACLWHKQGKTDLARQRLQQIYNWFTEGHDTPDLREAKTLLDEFNR